MNGKLFFFHRNWEIAFGQIDTFYLKCTIRCSLQSSSFFLQVKFSGWEDAKEAGQGLVNVWFSAVAPLVFKTWDPPISFLTLNTKWPWRHFKISFWNIVFFKWLCFILNLRFIIWSQNIFWRVLVQLVHVIKICVLSRQAPAVIIHLQNAQQHLQFTFQLKFSDQNSSAKPPDFCMQPESYGQSSRFYKVFKEFIAELLLVNKIGPFIPSSTIF